MAYSFSVNQSPITPQIVSVTDTSTNVSILVVKRRIYVSNALDEYLTWNGTVNYTEWALADVTINLNILQNNISANIRVDWLAADDSVVASENNNYPLSQFGKQFTFYLVQLQGLTPGIYQDTNYSGSLALLWTNIVAGDNAVTYGNDLSGSQNCFDRVNFMMANQQDFF